MGLGFRRSEERIVGKVFALVGYGGGWGVEGGLAQRCGFPPPVLFVDALWLVVAEELSLWFLPGGARCLSATSHTLLLIHARRTTFREHAWFPHSGFSVSRIVDPICVCDHATPTPLPAVVGPRASGA